MARYYLAPSLVQLRNELNARWPNRDKTSDGWVGDTAHAARKSDHNPDWDAGGIIRALDIDEDGPDMGLLLRELCGDPRVNYCIYEGRIYQAIHRFESRPYTGPNAHTKHLHVSIKHGSRHETDTTRWLPTDTTTTPTTEDWLMALSNDQQAELYTNVRDVVAILGAGGAAGLHASGQRSDDDTIKADTRDIRLALTNQLPALRAAADTSGAGAIVEAVREVVRETAVTAELGEDDIARLASGISGRIAAKLAQ